MSSTGPAGWGGHGSETDEGGKRAPGVVHGHLHYMKGATKEAAGRITGASGLRSSGARDKAAAVSELREARPQPDENTPKVVADTSNSDTTVVAASRCDGDAADHVGSGARQAPRRPVAGGGARVLGLEAKVERGVGKVVGCKGMQEEGARKATRAEGLRREEARGGGSGAVEGFSPAKGT